MRFGLFGSASARRGGAEFDSSEGFRDFIDYNVEAEALGFHSTFVVEHHFTGYGQVSATLNLLTWVGARTRRLRLGTAVMVLPWHNPVLLAEQAAAHPGAAGETARRAGSPAGGPAGLGGRKGLWVQGLRGLPMVEGGGRGGFGGAPRVSAEGGPPRRPLHPWGKVRGVRPHRRRTA